MKKILNITKIVSFALVALTAVPMLIHLLIGSTEECKIMPVHTSLVFLLVIVVAIDFFREKRQNKIQNQ